MLYPVIIRYTREDDSQETVTCQTPESADEVLADIRKSASILSYQVFSLAAVVVRQTAWLDLLDCPAPDSKI
jgi:hypothetical protein